MRSEEPSRTAWGTALHRAAHQIIEQGSIFRDPLAVRILGLDPESVVREGERRSARMRAFVALRARFAEDALADAVARGVCQMVVLGAGLDTFAYRNPFGERLRVFEVDHPATQAWKRERLGEAGIAVPDSLAFTPVDFERESLADGLAAAGFDAERAAFFTWLGVVPYLTEEAIRSTLGYIGSLPRGTEVIFDYSDPPETLSPDARASHDQLAARVEGAGEGFRTYFEPSVLHAMLRGLGFSEIQDSGPAEIVARWFPNRAGAPRDRGGHILLATVSPDQQTDPQAE